MGDLLFAEPGTVVRYRVPSEHGRETMWCREGMAVARDDGTLWDTYWNSGNDKAVWADWFDSVEVLGNLADYDPLPRGKRAGDYHPKDRLTVTRQGGLQRDEYVRKGATPHLGTRIRAQVQKVRDAESELRSAQWQVEFERRGLDMLLAERAAATQEAPEGGEGDG